MSRAASRGLQQPRTGLVAGDNDQELAARAAAGRPEAARRGHRNALPPERERRRRRQDGCGGTGRRSHARRWRGRAQRRAARQATARRAGARSARRYASGFRSARRRGSRRAGGFARGGSGTRHHIQSAASGGGRAAAARCKSRRGVMRRRGPELTSQAGSALARRIATMNTRGRDCGRKCAASIVSAPNR